MRVIIRNPEMVFFEGFARRAILPWEDGEFSIWDFNQTLIATLEKGNVVLNLGKGVPSETIKINPGVAAFDRNELMILCL